MSHWYRKISGEVSEKLLGMIRDFSGIEVHVENPAGTERLGLDPDGHEWRIQMKYDYGFIYSQKGEDNEGLDVYLGPDQEAKTVYIVHQVDPYDNHKKDEDKCMLGFASPDEAKKAYLHHYDRDDFFGSMTEMPFEEFKDIVISKKRDKVNWKKKGKKAKACSGWYKRASCEFEYSKELRNMWRNLVKDEQDRVDIKFDLENDNSIAKREIEIDNPCDNHYKTKILAELFSAGGDWQCPVCYFRCQELYKYNEDSKFSTGVKFIIIPDKNNSNLVKSKEVGHIARDSESESDCKDRDEKGLWEQLKKLSKKRLKDYYKERPYSGDPGFSNTGVVYDLVTTHNRPKK